MKTKSTLSISEARKKIFQIAKDVQKPNNYYTLTERGRPKAVIMSAEEFESWQETIEVMRDFPDLDKNIAEVEKALKTGAWKKWPTLEDLKKDWGIEVADKPKKKYAVRVNNKTKGKKKSK